MKKHLGVLLTVFALLLVLVAPQKSSANTPATMTITVSGQEYTITNEGSEYSFDVDKFMSENGIQESEKLEKISVIVEGAKTAHFNIGLLAERMDNDKQTIKFVNNKAEFIISEKLKEHDKGQDGIAISNLRQLLYPIGNQAKVDVTVTYENDNTSNLALSIKQNYSPEISDNGLVSLNGISLVTKAGEVIKASGTNNHFTLDLVTEDGNTKIDEIRLYSENAVTASIFTKDSYLYRDATDVTFVDGVATIDLAKLKIKAEDYQELADELGIPVEDLMYISTVQEIRDILHFNLSNVFNGFVADANGNESAITLTIKSEGWLLKDGNWYHYDKNGVAKTGWFEENDNWYYFNDKGVMQTGWVDLAGTWYYFASNGVMQTGWEIVGGKWYYMNDSGAMLTDWQQIDGTWYYFVDSGAMQTGWIIVGGKWYYMNNSGAMLTNWQQINDIWYYFVDSGAMQIGWELVGGKWYYMNNSGAMLTNWQQINGIWYYFVDSGAMQTGWTIVGGKWYYMNNSGAMLTNWQQINGTWYYFVNSGAMQTGWQHINGTWYYFVGSGAMQTGWLNLGGTWYYLYNSGAMATNTTVHGYKLAASGAWIR